MRRPETHRPPPPPLSPPAVLAERDVVLEERRQVVENDPGGPFDEQIRAALYLNHPYGHPVIGWQHEITPVVLGINLAGELCQVMIQARAGASKQITRGWLSGRR